jgi:hypothetical protein
MTVYIQVLEEVARIEGEHKSDEVKYLLNELLHRSFAWTGRLI